MKALIIGGNGFIGSNLADELLAAGHTVCSFDRYPSRYLKPNKHINYIFGDFANHGEVEQAVKGMDWIFHLAYTTLPATSNEDPAFDVRSNVIDTLQLLEACRNSQVKKTIFISSGGTIYGVPRQLPISEEHPTYPICSYGITKLTIEKYLYLYHHLFDLDYTIVRLSNPYGQLQNPEAKQGAVTVFLGNVLQGKAINVWGDGEVIRDYIYIKDAVCALVAAAQYCPAKDAPRTFNIGSGKGYSLNKIISTIKEVVPNPPTVNYQPSRSADVVANVLDIKRAKELLNWVPQIELKEGIEKTWRWLCTINK